MTTSFQALDWPAPENIRAGYTLRSGGVSQPPFDGFNLAEHVGDESVAVAENRSQLSHLLGGVPVSWLQQVHGVQLVAADVQRVQEADASFTDSPKHACCVMTADCLPVFFCDLAGTQVAVAHAGWRGLKAGILQATLNQFAEPNQVMAYLGPAISQRAFEVGDDVRDQFLKLPNAKGMALQEAFISSEQQGKWMADLYELARRLLQAESLEQIYGGERCTFTEVDQFFSYRRDGQTGRMANLIWME